MARVTNLLPEDGIVDPVAIWIAVSGQRVVRMTLTERQAAARILLNGGADTAEVGAKLGINSQHIGPFLAGLGYQLGRREGYGRRRALIKVAG